MGPTKPIVFEIWIESCQSWSTLNDNAIDVDRAILLNNVLTVVVEFSELLRKIRIMVYFQIWIGLCYSLKLKLSLPFLGHLSTDPNFLDVLYLIFLGRVKMGHIKLAELLRQW